MLADVTLPAWVTYTGAAAIFVGAVGTLWRKVFRPGLKVSSKLEVAIPLLSKLVDVYEGQEELLLVNKAIAMEFQRNHGTSLKDLVVGLQVAIDKAMARAEQVAFDANAAAEVLKVNVEATKLLAAQDRAQIARLLVIVDRLGVQAEDKESE